MLIALGGSMGVNDAAELSFLGEAMSVIRQAVERDVPYLGICLGGQLLAGALGARVRRTPVPEIGVIEVTLQEQSQDPLLRGLGPVLETVQFHEDTFDVPPGGTLLASSAQCPTQVVRCAARAYALQFHPEISVETFAGWIEAGYAQATGDFDPNSREAVVTRVRSRHEAVCRQSEALFDNFIALAAGAGVSLPGRM
jgi:GMP synthase-like glutamine amidotransferase